MKRLVWWRLRSNELRRSSDVREAWTALLLGVCLALGAPAAGLTVGALTWQEERAESAALVRDNTPVTAHLTEPAPEAVSDPPGGVTRHVVPVRWTKSDGTQRTASVEVPAGTDRGEPVTVWLDAQGRIAGRPLTAEEVTVHAVTDGVGTAAAVAASVLLLGLVLRRVTMRHRLAEWEAAWARTGPEWSGRRI
ncbi:hypothetical protein [Streptomyces sp. KLOTTS4A1]|uniref:Rv1733c family protein n=1 Tax=Streptomyces sp. KLOTTS4A1 TaxID=3390996 RepID=UPI0039F4552D